jgi:hypothetical protein
MHITIMQNHFVNHGLFGMIFVPIAYYGGIGMRAVVPRASSLKAHDSLIAVSNWMDPTLDF